MLYLFFVRSEKQVLGAKQDFAKTKSGEAG
jgi:hypothetical protein